MGTDPQDAKGLGGALGGGMSISKLLVPIQFSNRAEPKTKVTGLG